MNTTITLHHGLLGFLNGTQCSADVCAISLGASARLRSCAGGRHDIFLLFLRFKVTIDLFFRFMVAIDQCR